jgi:hypothetical protein
VDIPAELVREEIAQDAKVSRELIHFDPFLGNVLEPVVTYDSPSKTSAFLAFPMGELNRELSTSLPTPLAYVFHPIFIRPFSTRLLGGQRNLVQALTASGSYI